ncbi:hypothetical protein LCGC14_0412680 [marine sediment metagenome]|uniref:Uncharacterized protein n=1 Tax=marine sediment metagenome TaxID=412755 RepID=A0A0F9TBJ9_9ZZZZ
MRAFIVIYATLVIGACVIGLVGSYVSDNDSAAQTRRSDALALRVAALEDRVIVVRVSPLPPGVIDQTIVVHPDNEDTLVIDVGVPVDTTIWTPEAK